MTSMIRIKRELKNLSKDIAPGIHLVTDLINDSNLTELYIDITVADNPIYKNKVFRLRYRIPAMYPIEVPWVQFVAVSPTSVTNSKPQHFPIPMHPHVYSNGHICLDLLGDGWSPVQTISSVAISIQSMLAGNTLNERPEGDKSYVMRAPQNPKDTEWLYHDDNV